MIFKKTSFGLISSIIRLIIGLATFNIIKKLTPFKRGIW
jgi:hypothetical protein